MRSQVTSRGRITIPKQPRDRLDIRSGDLREFGVSEEQHLVARKLQTRDPVDAVYGTMDLAEATAEFVERLREGATRGF